MCARLTKQVRKIGSSDCQICLWEIPELLFQVRSVAADDFKVRREGDVEACCADNNVDFVLVSGLVDYAIFCDPDSRLCDDLHIRFCERLQVA